MKYCTSIGIDTHSRKNAICALSTETGTVTEDVLSEDPARVGAHWVRPCAGAQRRRDKMRGGGDLEASLPNRPREKR